MLYTPPPTGSLVLLASATVAASTAVVDFTGIDGTYENYLIQVINAIPVAATNPTLGLRTSTDGGASFAAVGTDYTSNGSTSGWAYVAQSISSTVLAGGANATITLFDPAGTASYKRFHAQSSPGASVAQSIVVSERSAAAAYNAVRLMFTDGNIASGKFKLYGMQKA